MENPPPPPASLPPLPPSASGPRQTSGLAITSLILGILSLIGGVLLLLPPLLAIIFGHISVSQCNRNRALSGKGLGIAGLVMGYVSGLVLIPLMAAMAIPAFQKVRTASQDKAMINNMRMLAAAADQYYLEHSKTTVAARELIGPNKYIQVLNPVMGEKYSETLRQGQPVVATRPDGTELRYPP